MPLWLLKLQMNALSEINSKTNYMVAERKVKPVSIINKKRQAKEKLEMITVWRGLRAKKRSLKISDAVIEVGMIKDVMKRGI